jgi:hypothetical protein
MTTEKKPRAPKNSLPLGAGEAFDRIAARRDTRVKRRQDAIDAIAHAFDNEEQLFEEITESRVPLEQRDRLDVMLRAYHEAQKMAAETANTEQRPPWLDEPAPEKAPVVEIDRGAERKTGARRG